MPTGSARRVTAKWVNWWRDHQFYSHQSECRHVVLEINNRGDVIIRGRQGDRTLGGWISHAEIL